MSSSRFDGPDTGGFKNSSEMITSQDTNEIDEYRRQRISERLRIEKELFPDCIQAPATYYNKRKSLNVSKWNKENRHSTVFPGEVTSSSKEHTMNKSRNIVQEWLKKQPDSSLTPHKRSPFSDLKVNTHHRQPSHSTPVKSKQKENALTVSTRQSSRKKSRIKQTHSTGSPINLENYLKPVEKHENKTWSAKRLKREFEDSKHVSNKADGRATCEESGIVIDDDVFTIEDTQDQVVDKDKMALLEVQKASMHERYFDADVNDEASISIKNDKGISYVPFYKKSQLFKNCSQCINAHAETLNDHKLNSTDNALEKPSDISITVENKSIIATISIVDRNPNKLNKIQSTAVQTDVVEPFLGFEQSSQKQSGSMIAKMKQYIETEEVNKENKRVDFDSQETFCTELNSENQDQSDKVNANIEQDDNMLSAGCSSEQDLGVLTALDGAGFQNKRKRRLRGATPDSNNSSDKENCDPNRKKKGDLKNKKRKFKK